MSTRPEIPQYAKILTSKERAYEIFEIWLRSKNRVQDLTPIVGKNWVGTVGLVFNFFLTTPEEEIALLREFYRDKEISIIGPLSTNANLWLRKLFQLGFKPEVIVKRNPMSKDAQNFISKKISQLVHEGYEISQAIAIAYSMAVKAGYKIPKVKKKNPQNFVKSRAEKRIQKILENLEESYPELIEYSSYEIGHDEDLLDGEIGISIALFSYDEERNVAIASQSVFPLDYFLSQTDDELRKIILATLYEDIKKALED